MPEPEPATEESVLARIFRESAGRAVATLARVFGDLDLAEDAVQEAFAVAIERWPTDGLPPNPGGWIVTTARHKALDRLRREATRYRPRGAGGGPHRRTRARTGGGTGGGRSTAPYLHLLPPGARPGGADRAHPAADRRAADARRSPARSSSPSRRSRSAWSGPSARSGTRGFRTGYRATTSSRSAFPTSSRSSTWSSTRATPPRPATALPGRNSAQRRSAWPRSCTR